MTYEDFVTGPVSESCQDHLRSYGIAGLRARWYCSDAPSSGLNYPIRFHTQPAGVPGAHGEVAVGQPDRVVRVSEAAIAEQLAHLEHRHILVVLIQDHQRAIQVRNQHMVTWISALQGAVISLASMVLW